MNNVEHRFRPIKIDKKGKINETKAVKVPGLARQAIAKGFGKFIAGIKAVPNFIADKATDVADKITNVAYESRENRISNINREISAVNNTIEQNANIIHQFTAAPMKTAEDYSDISEVMRYISNLSTKVENLENQKWKLKRGTFWFSAFFGHKEDNITGPENENTQAEITEQEPTVEPVQSVEPIAEPIVEPNAQVQTPVVPEPIAEPTNPIEMPKVEEPKHEDGKTTEGLSKIQMAIQKFKQMEADNGNLSKENSALTQENVGLKVQVTMAQQEKQEAIQKNEQLSADKARVDNENKDLKIKLDEQTKINGEQAASIARLNKEKEDNAKEKDLEINRLQGVVGKQQMEIDEMTKRLNATLFDTEQLKNLKILYDRAIRENEELARAKSSIEKGYNDLMANLDSFISSAEPNKTR